MMSALGVLRWPPSEFWASTMFEYSVAVKGYLAAKGVKTEGGMTREEFLDLKAADEKRRKA